MYARLGFLNDEYGTLSNLHWIVWEHQVWRYVKHIEKVLSLTHYEALMTLIGYWIIANQLCYEGMGYQYCMFGHHTQCEPERLCSSIYSTSVSLHYCDIPSQVADDVSSILRMISFTCPLALPRLINPELLESQSIINARLCYEQDYSQLLLIYYTKYRIPYWRMLAKSLGNTCLQYRTIALLMWGPQPITKVCAVVLWFTVLINSPSNGPFTTFFLKHLPLLTYINQTDRWI